MITNRKGETKNNNPTLLIAVVEKTFSKLLINFYQSRPLDKQRLYGQFFSDFFQVFAFFLMSTANGVKKAFSSELEILRKKVRILHFCLHKLEMCT